MAVRLLAAPCRRAIVGPASSALRSKDRLRYLHSFPGQWKQAASEDLCVLTQATGHGQQQSAYSLGISAILLFGEGVRWIRSEERHSDSPQPRSFLNEKTDVNPSGGTLQESDLAEVTSNVHTAKWRVFTDQGRDLFSKGRLDEAEKYLNQALEEAKQGFGEKDPHVASSCNNLAELYRMKGDYEKAERLFLEAIQGLEKAFKPSHVSVSFTLHNLGSTYLVQRKFDQARRCYERSLEIKEQELGPHHPEFANTMFHLGEVLRLQGNLSDAEKHIRDSIEILQEDGAGYSQLVIKRMGRLVQILSQTGQLREAEKLQRQILHQLELSQGVESSNTTMAAENLAGTLQAVGKLEEAEELLQRSFEVRQKILPPTHMQLGVTMFKLASVSIERGVLLASTKTTEGTADARLEYERAEELLRRAIRIAERSWKPVASSQTSAAMRAGPLISLLRSLDALGHLEMHKLDLATTAKELDSGRKEAESLFRHCLSVLDKPGVSQDLASVPEFRRQHIACLQHLAGLLSSTSKLEDNQNLQEEVNGLLNKSKQLEAELKRTTGQRAEHKAAG